MSGGLAGNDRTGGGDEAGPAPLIFRETQRFRQWFFYVPVAIVTAVVWWQFIEQIIRSRPVGENPIPDWLAWVLTLVFGLGFPAFAATVRMVTEVRPGELSVRLFPFRATRIATSDIASAEVRQYSPMTEYGGWGVRVSRKYGKAYNASGNLGVQLVLRNGERLLIGTQDPERLLQALQLAGVS